METMLPSITCLGSSARAKTSRTMFRFDCQFTIRPRTPKSVMTRKEPSSTTRRSFLFVSSFSLSHVVAVQTEESRGPHGREPFQPHWSVLHAALIVRSRVPEGGKRGQGEGVFRTDRGSLRSIEPGVCREGGAHLWRSVQPYHHRHQSEQQHHHCDAEGRRRHYDRIHPPASHCVHLLHVVPGLPEQSAEHEPVRRPGGGPQRDERRRQRVGGYEPIHRGNGGVLRSTCALCLSRHSRRRRV